MAIIPDVYSGLLSVPWLAHLSVSPVVTPYRLGDFIEASWLGYTPAGVSVKVRIPQMEGMNEWLAEVWFGNATDVAQTPTLLWIDAEIDGQKNLLVVTELPSGDYQNIPVGGTAWTLFVQLFQGQG